jgi:hypothetical protein
MESSVKENIMSRTTTVPIGLYAGFDIGSQAVHYAVLDSGGNVVYSPRPVRHLANPIQALGQAWKDITGKFSPRQIKNTAFTGSGALFIRDAISVHYDYDSVAIPAGAALIAPDAQYISYRCQGFLFLSYQAHGWETCDCGVSIQQQMRRRFRDPFGQTMQKAAGSGHKKLS